MSQVVYIKKLGQGSFGEVSQIQKDGINMARKVIKLDRAKNQSKRKLAYDEIKMLENFNHRYLIHYYASGEDSRSNSIYIDMELCEKGDLHELLVYLDKGKNYFSNSVATRFSYDLCEAVYFLHSNNIMHRDLKEENIFLSFSGEPIIADIGLGRIVKGARELRATHAGSPLFMAPEVLNNKKYTMKCDVWSLGLIIYAIFKNSPPNEFVKEMDQLKRYVINPIIGSLPKHVDPRVKLLVENMLKPEDRRWDMRQVMSYCLFEQFQKDYDFTDEFALYCYPATDPTESVHETKQEKKNVPISSYRGVIVSEPRSPDPAPSIIIHKDSATPNTAVPSGHNITPTKNIPPSPVIPVVNERDFNPMESTCVIVGNKVITGPGVHGHNNNTVHEEPTVGHSSFSEKEVTSEYFRRYLSIEFNQMMSTTTGFAYGYHYFYAGAMKCPKTGNLYLQLLHELQNPDWLANNIQHASIWIPSKSSATLNRIYFDPKTIKTYYITQLFNVFLLFFNYYGYELYSSLQGNYLLKRSSNFKNRINQWKSHENSINAIQYILDSLNSVDLHTLKNEFYRRISVDLSEFPSKELSQMIQSCSSFIQESDLLDFTSKILNRM